MRTKDNEILLERYRAPGSKVFTGRDRGEYVRKQSKLDEIANKFEDVYFVIPDNIYSINPSFFEELFVNVVQKFKKEGFLKRFHFIAEGQEPYPYEKPLNEAIERILRESTGLDV
jgi:hypothetical protein